MHLQRSADTLIQSHLMHFFVDYCMPSLLCEQAFKLRLAKLVKSILTGNNDYDPGPYHLTIPAGMTRVRFTVTITDDDVQEIDETFRLSIRNNLSDDFTFSNRVAIVTIINDDIDGMLIFNS